MKPGFGFVLLAITCGSSQFFVLRAQGVDTCVSSSTIYYHREPKALPSEVISTPFVVTDVSGTITYSGGKPLEGANVEMLLGAGSTVGDESSMRGHFTLGSLRSLAWLGGIQPGSYCFRVTKAGFHSVIGLIVVSRKAPKEAVVAIDLKPGEGYRDGPPDEQLLPASAVPSFVVPNPKKYPQKYAAVYMPVSLAAERVRTPEFTVKKQQWYDIVLQVEKPLPFNRMNCMMGTTDPLDRQYCSSDDPVLRANWTVWLDGRIVRWGSVPDEDHAKWTADSIGKMIGNFPGEAGKEYVIQVHFTKDGRALDVAKPHLIIIPEDSW